MARRFDLATFETFRDTPGSAFYAVEGLSPEETWVRIIAGQERALATAIDLTLARQTITPEWIANAHRLIFEETFPADAGRFRGFMPDGSPEDVWFGVSVGTAQTARVRPMKGAHPNRIVERLDRACLEFDQTSDELKRGVATVRSSALACSRLYAKAAATHPFVDGNLRAAWIAFQAALLSLELPIIQFPDLDAHDMAMDTALRVDGNQSYFPLAELVEDIVKSAR